MTERKGLSESGMPPPASNEGYPEREVLAVARSMGDDTTHYMESTSRLRAENEELFEMSQRDRRALEVCRLQRMTAEATMREVADRLRDVDDALAGYVCVELADRLDPKP